MQEVFGKAVDLGKHRGSAGMTFKPKPLYRMARCRNCPRHGRPCLTLEEAEHVFDMQECYAQNGNGWRATTICDACHQKSNESQNRRTYAKAGRDWDEGHMTPKERLLAEIAKLEKELARLK